MGSKEAPSSATATVRACPAFPRGGSDVKAELDRVCPIAINEHGQEVSTCPAIDAWHARVWIFEKQLQVAR